MSHTVMPPLTTEVRNIFSISSSHFHTAYFRTHTGHASLKVPDRQAPAQESPHRVITDYKHCERVKSKDSLPIVFNRCDPYYCSFGTYTP